MFLSRISHQLRTPLNVVLGFSERLDPTRIESGKMAVELADGVLVPLDDSLRVRADTLRLKQVLLNRLSNAVKYNRSGGAVTVSTEVQTGGGVVPVADTGAGRAA